MNDGSVTRDILADGRVRLASPNGRYVFSRLAPDVLLIETAGNDAGEFGTIVVDEVASAFLPEQPMILLLDCRHGTGAAPSVNVTWLQFLKMHRHRLARIDALMTSRVLQLMASVIRHLSRTGDIATIHTDPQAFDAVVDEIRRSRA